MDETATRRKKIDPQLYAVGWEQVPESEILTEQRAYVIAPGLLSRMTRHPKKADYVLQYKGRKLAVIEAKSDEKDVSEGVEQAKLYAEMLNIRFAYATNGDEIWAIDMGVKDARGTYLVPSTEGPANKFPSPQELWQMTYPNDNEWRDRFNLLPYNRDGGRTPRYYQENAIDAVLAAVAAGQQRILLTMATGTGKTYVAFQICWKLFQTGWNKDHAPQRKPRILFITDRNVLANQASNDFDNFSEDARERITPELLRDKYHLGHVSTSRSIYFTIFQTLMTPDATGNPYYKQYPKNFFDFIIIDECHRGGANDESEWRVLMDYFNSAYQLGMTATPRRKENANTYTYFGDAVYTYSLKQGIADGFLTPYRLWVSESNIDTYQYCVPDEVIGDIDPEKVYTEKDFYNGQIEIRQRDEYRVKQLLEKIGVDEKTIVFCATQKHAAIVRDMINQHKRCPDNNYCRRVTADDGSKGEMELNLFQNNDYLRPTVLTTSQKLSTGVDARNVRNIVLMRPVENMIEFKQIIGRGTRLFDDKYFFTIYDFVGAHKNFKDPDWDGDPVCPKCGNWPCTCEKKPPRPCPVCGNLPCTCPPRPCPVCGNLPCTCPPRPKRTITVKLADGRERELKTKWTEMLQFGDEIITVEEFVNRIYGRIPTFFDGPEDLRTQWSHPQTRKELLDLLEREGFAEEKLNKVRTVLSMEQCDLLDVLEYIAYETPAVERARRVEMVRKEWLRQYNKQQQEFFNFILDYYVRNDYKELADDKLPTFINIKYHSMQDALTMLGVTVKQLRSQYIAMQQALYNASASVVINGDVHVHGNASIGNYFEK